MKNKTMKLLILGATNDEIAIVSEAKSMGLYTIVTDNHSDWALSPAKYHADEAWNISWSDIDSLAQKSREEGVGGVIAGFSEFRVENMLKLCRALSLPSYINEKQLDITRDKLKFKQFCREHQIPTVQQYDYDDKDMKLPVIIKPVDRAGGIGINVAYNKKQYDKYLGEALSLSPSKTVIVEDFIENGVKFDCYYVINDSVVELLCTSDTLMHSKSTKGHETIQKAWVIPSLYEEDFRKQYDELFKNMIRHLGFKNGYTSISCFYKDGICFVFEAGFRLTGGHSFDYQYATSGTSYLRTMINHSLGLPVQQFICPKIQSKAITYNLYIKTPCVEKVISIEGLDSFKDDKSFITVIPKMNIGTETKPNMPMKFAMVTVLADMFDEVRSRIDRLNASVFVKTESNIYYSDAVITDEELRKYWSQ